MPNSPVLTHLLSVQKKATTRAATASARVQLNNAAFSAIASGKSAKGDALTVAQLAGTDF